MTGQGGGERETLNRLNYIGFHLGVYGFGGCRADY